MNYIVDTITALSQVLRDVEELRGDCGLCHGLMWHVEHDEEGACVREECKPCRALSDIEAKLKTQIKTLDALPIENEVGLVETSSWTMRGKL